MMTMMKMSLTGFKKALSVLAFTFMFHGAMAAVDINTATVEQLKAIKGIGEVKAKAIVDYRTAQGGFKTVDELKKVTGFGDKSFEAVKGEFTVGMAKSADKAAPKMEAGKTVDINTATAKELEALPEVGAKKAMDIVDYRTKNGGFKSIDELTKVNGIGEATLTKIKPFLSLSAKAEKAEKTDKSNKK